jgi:hypothetical protein
MSKRERGKVEFPKFEDLLTGYWWREEAEKRKKPDIDKISKIV